MPKVSVIIPVYNVERYLRQCLDSVVNQTLHDIEIICVNDHSPDGSWDILKEYEAKDSRIRLLNSSTNDGLGASRNKGLDVARGEYVMFLDSDDWLELNACEIAYNKISQYKTNMLLFDMKYFNCCKIKFNNGSKIQRWLSCPDLSKIKVADLNFNFMGSAEACYKIYRRDFLEKFHIRFSTLRAFEDTFFWVKCLVFTEYISVIEDKLYNYRRNNHSILGNCKNYLMIFDSRNQVLDWLIKEKHSVYIPFFIAAYISSVEYYFFLIPLKKWHIKRLFFEKMKENFTRISHVHDVANIKVIRRRSMKRFRKIIKYSYLRFIMSEFLKGL